MGKKIEEKNEIVNENVEQIIKNFDFEMEQVFFKPDGFMHSCFNGSCDICGAKKEDIMFYEICHIKGKPEKYNYVCDECLKLAGYKREPGRTWNKKCGDTRWNWIKKEKK